MPDIRCGYAFQLYILFIIHCGEHRKLLPLGIKGNRIDLFVFFQNDSGILQNRFDFVYRTGRAGERFSLIHKLNRIIGQNRSRQNHRALFRTGFQFFPPAVFFPEDPGSKIRILRFFHGKAQGS